MKSAVVFYSMGGNTRMTAEKTANKLGADLIEIFPKKTFPDKGAMKFIVGGRSAVMKSTPKLLPYEFDPDKYDRVIIGSPIWAGTFAPPIRSFLKDQKNKLKEKKTAVFFCSSGGGIEKALKQLTELLGGAELEATLSLIDPKDKPNEENDGRIEKFCASLS